MLEQLKQDAKPSEEELFYNFDRDPVEAAEKQDCVCIFPAPNQLFLDLDTEEQYQYFRRRYRDITKYTSLRIEVEESLSKSGYPHRHIILTFFDVSSRNFTYVPRNFTEHERIAYQVMFGSDPVREGLNAQRVMLGVANPTCLFKPK